MIDKFRLEEKKQFSRLRKPLVCSMCVYVYVCIRLNIQPIIPKFSKPLDYSFFQFVSFFYGTFQF